MRNSESTPLSPLERALLEQFHDLYCTRGFPSPNEVQVLRRENTGGGRNVSLSAEATLTGDDGYLDMGGRFVEMEGVPHGLMAVVSIANSKVDQLEIAVYGDASWNGDESKWAIV